jgi:hypothetical protein
VAVKPTSGSADRSSGEGQDRVVGLIQPFSIHAPGWVNKPSPKNSFAWYQICGVILGSRRDGLEPEFGGPG